MDVIKLTYKGKQYPIRISYFALKHFKSETGKEFGAASDDLASFETLLFLALQSGHKFLNETMTLQKTDMEDMLDHVYNDFLAAIPQFFGTRKPEEGGADDAKKK